MLDFLLLCEATKYEESIEMMTHLGISNDCPEEYERKLDRLVAMTFWNQRFDGPQVSPIKRKPWRGLSTEIQHGFDSFFGKSSNVLTVCFLAEPDVETAFRNWMYAWQNAANSKKAVESLAQFIQEV